MLDVLDLGELAELAGALVVEAEVGVDDPPLPRKALTTGSDGGRSERTSVSMRIRLDAATDSTTTTAVTRKTSRYRRWAKSASPSSRRR
jgi:hypothetical protein